MLSTQMLLPILLVQKVLVSSLISIISHVLEYQQLLRLKQLSVQLVRASMELFGLMLKPILQVVVVGAQILILIAISLEILLTFIRERVFLLVSTEASPNGNLFSVLQETVLTSHLSQCGMLTTMVLPALVIGNYLHLSY